MRRSTRSDGTRFVTYFKHVLQQLRHACWHFSRYKSDAFTASIYYFTPSGFSPNGSEISKDAERAIALVEHVPFGCAQA